MNEIKSLVIKFRNAANILEELIGITKHNETPKTAKKIIKSVKSKSHSYNGKHWTQTPAGKAKMAKRMKLVWAEKKKNSK